jgi:dipeptidyl aminopeptidase/acylaminoacyl peptidase
MSLKSVKSQVIIAFAAIVVALLVSLSISYYALYKLTFAGDRVFYGKKLSDVACEIREELLKRDDLRQVQFFAQDGLKLSGFLLKRKKPLANMVLCHGYQGNKEFMYGFIDLFPDFNMFIFDFRAHGQSDGRITSIGYHEYKDVIAATQFMKEHTQVDGQQLLPTIVLGVSMGGAATLKAAEKESDLADVYIVDSTYANLTGIVLNAFTLKSGLPYYPFFPLIKQLYHYLANFDMSNMNPQESVKVIKQPILFIHSCSDSFISANNTLQLYTNAQNNLSRLWIGPSCRHGWLHSYHREEYRKKVLKFIARTLFQNN